jgi:hypothetical protein
LRTDLDGDADVDADDLRGVAGLLRLRTGMRRHDTEDWAGASIRASRPRRTKAGGFLVEAAGCRSSSHPADPPALWCNADMWVICTTGG